MTGGPSEQGTSRNPTRRTNIKLSRTARDQGLRRDDHQGEAGYQTDNSIEDLLVQWSAQNRIDESGSETSRSEQNEHEYETDGSVEALDASGGSTKPSEDSQDASLAFLVSSFPEKDPQVLADLLAQYGDVDRAIDAALSSDLLTDRDETSYSTPISSHRSDPSYLPTSHSKKTKKAQKRREKRSQARDTDMVRVNLTDLRHADLRPRQRYMEDPRATALQDPNRWVTTSSTLVYLAQLLRTDESSLQSLYHSSGGDMAIAVDAAVAVTIARKEDEPKDMGIKKELLKGLFPFTSEQLLSNAIVVTSDKGETDAQAHLDRSVDLVYALDEIKARYGQGKASEVRQASATLVATENSKETAKVLGSRSHSLDQDKLAALMARRDASLPDSMKGEGSLPSLNDHSTDLSAYECQARSEEYRQRRDEAFAKASSAWTTSKSVSGMRGQGGRGVAYYYANLGKEFDKLSRDWDLKAARVSVLDRRQQGSVYGALGRGGRDSANTIDLHGCTVHQGLSITREAINDWYVRISTTSLPPDQPVPRLTIVTGQGKHSPHGHSVLYPSIVKMLREEGWSFLERKHEGIIQVVKRGRV